jgi:uncharacterized protein (DUF2062 family)
MRDRIRRLLETLLKVNDSPERTALAFSLGVFLAFSPLLGLHTVLGVALAFLFNLNRVAVIVGVYTNTPWTLAPFYAFATYVGTFFYKAPRTAPLPKLALKEALNPHFWRALAGQWPLLIPMFIGSTILALIIAVIAYPVSLHLIKAYRSKVRS